jgi:hypothetical protein
MGEQHRNPLGQAVDRLCQKASTIIVGRFDTPQQAAADEAMARELHGEFYQPR